MFRIQKKQGDYYHYMGPDLVILRNAMESEINHRCIKSWYCIYNTAKIDGYLVNIGYLLWKEDFGYFKWRRLFMKEISFLRSYGCSRILLRRVCNYVLSVPFELSTDYTLDDDTRRNNAFKKYTLKEINTKKNTFFESVVISKSFRVFVEVLFVVMAFIILLSSSYGWILSICLIVACFFVPLFLPY